MPPNGLGTPPPCKPGSHPRGSNGLGSPIPATWPAGMDTAQPSFGTHLPTHGPTTARCQPCGQNRRGASGYPPNMAGRTGLEQPRAVATLTVAVAAAGCDTNPCAP